MLLMAKVVKHIMIGIENASVMSFTKIFLGLIYLNLLLNQRRFLTKKLQRSLMENVGDCKSDVVDECSLRADSHAV